MHAVAVGANRNFGITGGQTLAVYAGVVLAQLICAQARVEPPHEGWIRMATSAQLRDLLAIDLALPASLAAHGLIGIVAVGVAAVATGAGQTFLGVYILSELFLADSERLR